MPKPGRKQHQGRITIGEIAYYPCPSPDLMYDPFQRIIGPDLNKDVRENACTLRSPESIWILFPMPFSASFLWVLVMPIPLSLWPPPGFPGHEWLWVWRLLPDFSLGADGKNIPVEMNYTALPTGLRKEFSKGFHKSYALIGDKELIFFESPAFQIF